MFRLDVRLFARTYLLPMLLIAAAMPAAGQSVVLGILEDVRESYSGDDGFRGVRVVFQKVGAEWEAFPNNCPDQDCLKTVTSAYPREIPWTVAFDGRRLGQITGRTPEQFDAYFHVGLQRITSGSPVPHVGEPSRKFGGFIEAAVYRPLVANSQPYFKDPESWKPAQPSREIVRRLRQEFRKKLACKISPRTKGTVEPFEYRGESIKIVKAYVSTRGWTIARLRLAGAIGCDDADIDDEGGDKWFAVGPGQSASYLGTNIWLVDAGDYDNDGKSELVFAIDGYDRGGYKIFYDDFKKQATFEFAYH